MGGLRTDPILDRAFAEGYQASLAGDAESTNPHEGAGTPEEKAWDQGHRIEAQGGAAAHANTTAFTQGQLAASGVNLYQCVVGGTTGTGTAPTGVAPGVTEADGTVTWEWIGTGSDAELTGLGAAPNAGIPYVEPHALADGGA